MPLASGLSSVVRSLKADAVTVRNVFSGWDDAVGATIAAHARPVKLDGATLRVEVDDTAWATQLRYLSTDVLDRLQALGGLRIDRLDIVVTGGGRRARRT